MEILRAALGWASSGQAPPSARRASGDGLILGCEPNERALRFGLERGYRALARLTSDRDRRIELVDMANAIRPKTWSTQQAGAAARRPAANPLSLCIYPKESRIAGKMVNIMIRRFR